MESEKLDLGSKCTIIRAEELHSQLESLMQTGHDVEIDASATNQCDTAALQQIQAFINELTKEGRKVTWNAPSEATLATAKLLGLDQSLNLNRQTQGE